MKLLAFDLDGTVLDSKKRLTDRTLNALYKAGEKGVVLVPATGRIHNFIPEKILEIPGVRYLITSNGASVYDTKREEVIYRSGIPLVSAVKAVDYLLTQGVYIEIYVDGMSWNLIEDKSEIIKKFRIPESSSFFLQKKLKTTDDLKNVMENGKSIEKINLPFLEPDIRRHLYKKLTEMNLFKIVSSIGQNLEINNRDTNKGSALKALAEKLHIDSDDIFAAGDNNNDAEMLQYAGYSVAMGNATDNAAKAAKYRTCGCDEDGFAKAVEGYFSNFSH